jgi:putative colanic acid biosynthesis acetyltransferase WcaF
MIEPQYQDLSKFEVPPGFRGKDVIRVQLWRSAQATLFRLSPRVMYGFRRLLLRAFGAHIGRGVLIRPTATVTYPWNLTVGDYSWLGDDTVVYNLAPVDIGANVAIAHRVYLCTGYHSITRLTFDIGGSPILVGDEAWLADDVFVGPGVSIGRGAVIGARSSVFKDMPEGMVCHGSPCRPEKRREMEHMHE